MPPRLRTKLLGIARSLTQLGRLEQSSVTELQTYTFLLPTSQWGICSVSSNCSSSPLVSRQTNLPCFGGLPRGLGAQHRGIFSLSGPPPSKKFNQRRLVGWSPEEMYDVVAAVEHYHMFVPWCQKSRVLKRQGDTYMEAELEVGFQMLVERYVSKVNLERPRRVSCLSGSSMLFHHLHSSWSLEPGPSTHTCWITFNVDFAFNSALYSHVADLFFSEVVKQMVGAFEGRCAKLYGPSSLIKPRKAPSHQGPRPAEPAAASKTPKPATATDQ